MASRISVSLSVIVRRGEHRSGPGRAGSHGCGAGCARRDQSGGAGQGAPLITAESGLNDGIATPVVLLAIAGAVLVEQASGLVSLLVWLTFGAIAIPIVVDSAEATTVPYAVLSLTLVRMVPLPWP